MDDPAKEDQKSPLTYEETPVINPHTGEWEETKPSQPSESEDAASVIPEASRVFGGPGISMATDEPRTEEAPEPAAHKEKEEVVLPLPNRDARKPKPKRHMGTVVFVVLLFGLGIWLSSQLRSFFAPGISEEVPVPTLAPLESPAPSNGLVLNPSGPATSSAWTTYQVVSGTTKRPIEGISYQLPSAVKAPSCDSGGCASSGTNLPGGTRLTIAPRGRGQVLPDFRGAILTDVNGREFVMRQTTVGSVSAYEYIGDFTGRTAGGYSFTKMRGVLLPVSETLAIEFNHFAPAGQNVDFAADDAVFDTIIKTFRGGVAITPTVRPTVALPTATPASGSAF